MRIRMNKENGSCYRLRTGDKGLTTVDSMASRGHLGPQSQSLGVSALQGGNFNGEHSVSVSGVQPDLKAGGKGASTH